MSSNKINPFSLMFGKEPTESIARDSQVMEITETFLSDNPPTMSYMLTGPRGYGKTVMLSMISNKIAQNQDWIVIDLNPNRDMLITLAAHLYESGDLKEHFIKSKLNLSAFGIGFSIESNPPISDIEVALEKMLTIVKKQGKKVLISIDEVTNNPEMRVFASSYQIMVRKNLPVFLIMTGLFENIRNLQNEDSLTFLYRMPRIELMPLNINSMKSKYKTIFDLTDEEALSMAAFTKGYPYAFQVLGYLRWNHNVSLDELTVDFDSIMEDNVYEKIWSMLSTGDRSVLIAIAQNGGSLKTKEILAETGNSSSSYSTYRNRLSKSGLIDTSEYGTAKLTLPRFEVFINNISAMG